MQLKHFLLAILAVGILSASFHGLGLIKAAPWHIVYSDTLGFYQRISEPGLPYLDKNIEYPVITGFFMQLMAWLGQNRIGYFILNSLFLILFAGLATYFLYKITPDPSLLEDGLLTKRLASQSSKSEGGKNLWIFWILAPSMLVFSVYNWDIIALLFVILAFYFTAKNKNGWAAFFLALGFCAKLYPIVYLPILILKNPTFKNAVKLIAIFLVTFFILNSFFMIANFNGWSYFYTLNQTRNSNPDSIWTIARFFFRNLDIAGINILSLLLLASSYAVLIWKFRKESIIKLCFIATLLFLIFNKVFSPQYLLWLLPFFVLLPIPKKGWYYTLEFSNLAAFFIILPWFLVERNIAYFYYAAPFVVIRHTALIAILFLVIKKLPLNKNRPG